MKKTDTIVDLTRSMYKELKSMNREQMQQVLANIYEQGVKSVKQELLMFIVFVLKLVRLMVPLNQGELLIPRLHFSCFHQYT